MFDIKKQEAWRLRDQSGRSADVLDREHQKTARRWWFSLLAISALIIGDPISSASADDNETSPTVTELRAELDAANKKVASLTEELNRMYQYRFQTQSQLAAAKVEVTAQNNPLRGDKAAIRSIKKSAKSMTDMWAALTPFAQRYHHFNDRRDLAIGAMLVVGAFYDFGSPYPDDAKGGCVSINSETNFKPIDLTFDVMTQSDIGCCTDYTLMLESFLSYLKFETKALNNGGHQAVKLRIGDGWHYLDANSLIYDENYFNPEVGDVLYYFTPYAESRIQSFQQYVLVSLSLELETFKPSDWTEASSADHYALFDAEFLNDSATDE